jgi:hypothetical protein
MSGQPLPRSNTGLIVAIAIVIVLVLAGVGYYLLTRPGGVTGASTQQVDITSVNWELSGSSCSGDQSQSTSAGETVTAGTTITAEFTLGNTALFGSCTFSTPAVTAGFTISSSNAPVTVTAGGSQSLDLEIVTPSTSWTGVLTVTLTVTTSI